MTPRLILDADGLARLRVALGREARSLRPVRLRLDDAGEQISLDLPGVDYLAALLALDRPAYRDGTSLLADDEALDLGALADGLRDTLAGLPDRPDAGEAYLDLRLAARMTSPAFGAYLLDVVRAYRRSLPAVPKRPKAPRTAAGKTHAEHCRESRARLLADEEASVLAWLSALLDPEDPPPLGRALVADLHAQAVEALLDWRDGGDVLDNGREIREPGPRVFARVLDRYLGPRTRTKNGNAYTLTEEHMSPTTRAIIDRAARILADEARAEIEALTAALERVASAAEEVAA